MTPTTGRYAPDLGMARDFLAVMCEGERVTFQTFGDAADAPGGLAVNFTSELEEASPRLADLNARGAGIYFMVNRGDGNGRKTANVTAVRAFFVDLDGAPIGPVEDCGVDPHAIVESSPGKWHAYWLIDGALLSDFKPAQLALAKKFNGDPSVVDLPRVLRMPGFFHRKGAPVLTELRTLGSHQAYRFDDFVARLGLDLSQPAAIVPTTSSGGVGAQIPPGGRHKHLESLFGTLNRRGATIETINAALKAENRSRCDPPLNEDDVERTATSMFKRFSAQHAGGPALDGIDIAAAQAAAAIRRAAGGPLAASRSSGGALGAGTVVEAAGGADEDELSGLSHAPIFDSGMCPGILGEFIRAETKYSEAPPIGVLANVITRLSADIGRTCFIQVGHKQLHLRMNWLCAGPSGVGRKGTAAEIAEAVRRAAFAGQESTDFEPALMQPARVLTALSTGEGLVAQVRTSPRPEDTRTFGPPGLADNRLLADSQEFSSVLKKSTGRESTLSGTLREAFDGYPLGNASISNAMCAERPHIVVSASVPALELVGLLSGDAAVEVSNGLLNRFIITYQTRSKIIANPQRGARWVFDQFAEAYRLALTTAWGSNARYTVSADSTVELTMSPDARACYDEWYVTSQGRADAAAIVSLTVRESTFLRVYSAILALLRGQLITQREDIEAGILLLKYFRDSLEFIFSQGRQTADAQQMQAEAKKLLAKMTIGRPASMYELRHTPAGRRAVLIDWMQRQSPPWVSIKRIKPHGGGAVATELVRLR